GHRVDRAVPQVEPPLLLEVERPGTSPSEDGDLAAALVDRAVTVEPLGERHRRPARPVSCDQAVVRQIRPRPRAEARVARRLRRHELDDTQAIYSAGNLGVEARAG